MGDKVCEICGAPLIGHHQKYCSKQCRRKAAYMLHKGRVITQQELKACPVCGKTFRDNRRTYCSAECMREATRERDRERMKSPYVEAFNLKKEKKVVKKSLTWDEVIKGMKETGLQYGEYVTRYDK